MFGHGRALARDWLLVRFFWSFWFLFEPTSRSGGAGMLSSGEHVSIEDAGGDLLSFALDPENWTVKDVRGKAEYQRRVGTLRVYAQIEVNEELEAVLRI